MRWCTTANGTGKTSGHARRPGRAEDNVTPALRDVACRTGGDTPDTLDTTLWTPLYTHSEVRPGRWTSEISSDSRLSVGASRWQGTADASVYRATIRLTQIGLAKNHVISLVENNTMQ